MDHDDGKGHGTGSGGEDLLRRLEPLVRSVVARYARDGDAADELLQICRIRIHEKRGQCRDPEAVFGWARTLCRRVCVRAAGNERRDRERFVEYDDAVASAETPVPDALAASETGEMRSRLGRALTGLPAEQRQLLILHYWEGLNAVDIGRRLGLPPATVRTRLRRACLKLRRSPDLICYAPRRRSLLTGLPGGDTMGGSCGGSLAARRGAAP